MRIAVVSDIHSNLEALDAVLERARAEGAEHLYVLGDIVGYGADPQAVIERLLALPSVTLIAGNHDLATVDRFDTTWFNAAASAAIRWTRSAIGDDVRAVLERLEPRADPGPVLVHGSILEPAIEYVFNADQARESFDAEPFELCFFGHTHMPTVFERRGDGTIAGRALADGEPIGLDGGRFMVNPGSVGQPRDRDPRASMMIFDAERRNAVVHRVPYDVARAQEKIRAAGLPEVLADRLAVGR